MLILVLACSVLVNITDENCLATRAPSQTGEHTGRWLRLPETPVRRFSPQKSWPPLSALWASYYGSPNFQDGLTLWDNRCCFLPEVKRSTIAHCVQQSPNGASTSRDPGYMLKSGWLPKAVRRRMVSNHHGHLYRYPVTTGPMTGQGRSQMPKATHFPSKKNYKAKKLILFTTFTLHIKLHSELQWRRNALNVLWCYKSTDLTPLSLMQYWSICHHCSTET